MEQTQANDNFIEEKRKFLRWIIFIKERFEPYSHTVMIALFLIVHYLVALRMNLISVNKYNMISLSIAVTLFYFKLRLYDEIKDYELDVVINKHRPLPRGLLTHKDMHKGIILCIISEIVLFATRGWNSFFAILIVIAYSLLMFKEFFIKEKIRPKLTTYAMMHTIVTTLLSLAIFVFLSKGSIFKVVQNKTFLYFAFVNWLLFNVFEFGRKTFATEEERDTVDTYSSLFGRTGAALLVISQRVASVLIIINIDIFKDNLIIYSFGLLMSFLLAITISYLVSDHEENAKLFRLMSSIYIIIFYIILAIGLS